MATGKPLAFSQLNVPFSEVLERALKVQAAAFFFFFFVCETLRLKLYGKNLVNIKKQSFKLWRKGNKSLCLVLILNFISI